MHVVCNRLNHVMLTIPKHKHFAKQGEITLLAHHLGYRPN